MCVRMCVANGEWNTEESTCTADRCEQQTPRVICLPSMYPRKVVRYY